VVFDDEMDAILEKQRLEDARVQEPDPMEERPKRKREILSNKEYLLRKQRTDDLFEGLHRVRERSVSPINRLSGKEEGQSAIEEKEERLHKGRSLIEKACQRLSPMTLNPLHHSTVGKTMTRIARMAPTS
jgi:hypothetical protein